jgi:hypothetical protein
LAVANDAPHGHFAPFLYPFWLEARHMCPVSLPLRLFPLVLTGLLFSAAGPLHAAAAFPGRMQCWRVDDLRRGMKGYGRTVLKGTRIETFQVEILGVLRNTSPGRDLVLARLSGLGLEKTGVIAGMSGSPVYVEGKLVGAVAYAWPFGKEPIAGITPFGQMQGFVEALERRDEVSTGKPVRVGLRDGLRVGNREFSAVTISQGWEETQPREQDGLFLMPLRSPLAASGFTPDSLRLLSRRLGRFGLVPMQAGAASARIVEEEKDTPLEPGGPLAVSLIRGDFDLSGIGTVTHVEGNRIYGWGHPFLGLGGCGLPMMTGYIHTVYPRQTVSFKMGSPLREMGVMHADVSTCIAGHLGKKADLLPVRMTVAVGKDNPRTFKVEVARHRALLSSLVYTALVNSVDLEGELPEELTAHLNARIELEGADPVIIKDTFSGFSGSRAPAAVYSQVASTLSMLTYNPHRTLRIKRIDCDTRVEPGRLTAEIESIELDSEEYQPGDTVRAVVILKPYKAPRQRVHLALHLPADLPEGEYTATACDEPTTARADVHGDPTLLFPASAEKVLESLRVLTGAKRTTLALRVPIGAHGVATGGKALPRLPGSMVRILANSRRTGAMTMSKGLVARQGTEWVIQGSEQIKFTVSKTRKVTRHDD